MNTYSEYDVDDDLPANTSENTTKTVTKMARISKNKTKEEGEEGKTVRKPRPKLDFNRLLKGSRGLGYLAVCTKKNLKLSGKPGGEANDLSQICVYLQEWAKQVFPKMPLMEFLLKVEDICQSRIMKACVPQILARLNEMGEDVDLKDLETVESEIMTKLATTEAEKAMENISASLETQPAPIKTDLDFNIDELLIGMSRSRTERTERSERTEFTDNESENESEDDEEEFAKEMGDFIDDGSDESEAERPQFNSESEEEEAEFSDSDKPKVKRGITFNFGESEDGDSDAQQEQEDAMPITSLSTIINDDEDAQDSAPVKKRNIAVIMDSDSD